MRDMAAFTAELVDRHGELVSQQQLGRLLGYSNAGAIRKARERGGLPVATFFVPGRRGRFAFTRDLAAWLIELRRSAVPEETRAVAPRTCPSTAEQSSCTHVSTAHGNLSGQHPVDSPPASKIRFGSAVNDEPARER
jgi:hypothetical protein